jgi:hypothetical protein
MPSNRQSLICPRLRFTQGWEWTWDLKRPWATRLSEIPAQENGLQGVWQVGTEVCVRATAWLPERLVPTRVAAPAPTCGLAEQGIHVDILLRRFQGCAGTEVGAARRGSLNQAGRLLPQSVEHAALGEQH